MTGNIERSDSMESVIEEIANSSTNNSVDNVLSMNEWTLEFYDWNKNLEFRKAIANKYVFFSWIVHILTLIYAIFFISHSLIIRPFIGPLIPDFDDKNYL